jgi:hypothetical protein
VDRVSSLAGLVAVSDRWNERGSPVADAGFVEYEPGAEFPGKIGKTIDDSTEAWPTPKAAPTGAPNVLFYVLDDVGFGQLSPYGGLVNAPNLQRVADSGVMYTNFHTTGLCSPTRTCIITGRNHHSNAMGSISEVDRLPRLRRSNAPAPRLHL